MFYTENKVVTDALRRNEYTFWCAALILLAVFAGSDAWRGREAFLAEAVREMHSASNCLKPIFNWEAIRNAPAPLLWEGVLFGKLFGVSEWTLRIVVALNGLLLLAGTVALGKHFFDRRVALFSGVLLLGCGGFLYLSRLFLEAIPAAACGIWAVFLLQPERQKNVWRPVGFALLLFLTTLFGTFYAALPTLGAAIALRLATSPVAPPDKRDYYLWGAITVGFLTAAYFLRAYGVLPPDWPQFSANGARHYLRAAFWDGARLFFPWSLWGVAALIRNLITLRKRASNFRSFTFALLTVWLLSVIPAAGNGHRMIFLLPIWSILTAATLAGEETRPKAEIAVDFAMRYLTMIAGAFAVASIIMIPALKTLFEIDVPALILLTVPVAGVITQAFLLFDQLAAERFALPKHCGGTVLAALTLTAAAISVILPRFAEFRTEREFIVNKLQSPLKNLPESSILYYDREPDAAVLFYSDSEKKLNVAGGEKVRKEVLREFLARNNDAFVAVLADADPVLKKEIAEVAADFGMMWDLPSAQETRSAFCRDERSLTLYYGISVMKKEEISTSVNEEQ